MENYLRIEYSIWKALLARLDSNNKDQDKNGKTEVAKHMEVWKKSVAIKYSWSNLNVSADIDNFYMQF